MRTKQVVISSAAGARLSTVSSSITCNVELSPSGLVQRLRPGGEPFGKPHRQRLIGRRAGRLFGARPKPPRAQATQQQAVALEQTCLTHCGPPLCRNTWRKVAAGLPARACRHRPAKRSTSAGSVISVSVSAPRWRATADQQQLVAAAEQMDLLVVGQRGAAEHFERLGRQDSQPTGRRPAKHPHDQEEDPQHHRQAAADGRDRLKSVRPLAGLGVVRRAHEASAAAARTRLSIRPPASRRSAGRTSGWRIGSDLGRQSGRIRPEQNQPDRSCSPTHCAFPCVVPSSRSALVTSVPPRELPNLPSSTSTSPRAINRPPA